MEYLLSYRYLKRCADVFGLDICLLSPPPPPLPQFVCLCYHTCIISPVAFSFFFFVGHITGSIHEESLEVGFFPTLALCFVSTIVKHRWKVKVDNAPKKKKITLAVWKNWAPNMSPLCLVICNGLKYICAKTAFTLGFSQQIISWMGPFL